jgi:DNA modification methylase
MLQIQTRPVSDLKPYVNNARVHSKKQVTQIARSIKNFGFNNPIVIDQDNTVLAGHGRLSAAIALGMTEVPTICLEHMTIAQKKAYILADNKLAEKAGWDSEILKIELQNLSADVDFDLTLTGFGTPEIDLILHDGVVPAVKGNNDPVDKLPTANLIEPRVQQGDLWQLGDHRLYCGDSRKRASFEILLEDKKADLVFVDPPYNVRIDGHVGGNGKVQHAEFVCASGEMSEAEFTEFLKSSFEFLIAFSRSGSIHYVCMDWRHVSEMMSAGKVYSELKNICVWNKQLGGMGSLYRSQHEFIFVFKNGAIPHINNIELGKHGRYRTNIWDYPGIHVSNSHGKELAFHPTVKPVRMIVDAILDCSNNGDVVLDCFAGSGSTLLAAHKVGRRAYLIEYDQHYCDVILYRFETMTGLKSVRIQGGTNVL